MKSFSVIMPVWNRAGIVGEAVASVLNQTFHDFELLIIDDGSEDDLEGAVGPYLSDRVRYHRIAHQGCAAARNSGVRLLSRGRSAIVRSLFITYGAPLSP